jgi:hypothetical protein
VSGCGTIDSAVLNFIHENVNALTWATSVVGHPVSESPENDVACRPHVTFVPAFATQPIGIAVKRVRARPGPGKHGDSNAIERPVRPSQATVVVSWRVGVRFIPDL